jgi:eukaryotic-like serine/threonine-protein kinase
MTSQFEAVEEIFHAALDCEPDQLNAFLDERCGGDKALRGKVEELLAAHRQAGSFIAIPIASLDGRIDQEIDPVIGQVIGRYKISKRISAGGMGAVYLAERADEQYHKRVAIKLIKRGMDTDSVLRHFRNERQILASFDHPNIARLLDGGATQDGLPYFVMEYVEGLPIDQYCTNHALSITEGLELFREMCAAVAYAHRHAVIHRDIKPSNILVTSDGTPKLLDFGIAKILQPGAREEGLATITGVRLMTPEYASPEQVRGEAVTTATDVYSLGVVLYQLLTGQKPYSVKTRTPEEISRAILEQEPTRPSSALKRPRSDNRDSVDSRLTNYESRALRGDLDNIVLMALRKEPERRYQTVEQFSDDIRRHLESLPVVARKDSFGYRAVKFVQRNKAVTAAATLVFLTLIGGIIATTWEARRARAENARAERRFNDVRHLAHSVLFDYHDAIKDLPGATRVRERLVKDALTYLDNLSREAAGDPALQRELAAAYDRVGDVRGELLAASFGDMAGALDSYEKATRIREALAAADPRDFKKRRDLAGSYAKIGLQLQESADFARGFEYLRKAFALYSDLAAKKPADVQVREGLAEVHSAFGIALESRGDAAGSLEHRRQALRLRKELLTSDYANEKYRAELAVSYINIGRALVLSGDMNAALEANQKGVELCAALVAEHPKNAKYRRRLAIGYQNNGDYRAIAGDVTGALESFHKKLQLDEGIFAADPANAQARIDIAYSYARIGELLATRGDLREALGYERKALGFYEQLAADSPEELDVRYRTSVVGGLTAELHAKVGERKEALAVCNTVSSLLKELPEDPANTGYSDFRAQAYSHLGAAHVALADSTKSRAGEQQEDWRVARDFYQRSLAIWQEMQKRGILTAEIATKPEETARELAKCDAALAR